MKTKEFIERVKSIYFINSVEETENELTIIGGHYNKPLFQIDKNNHTILKVNWVDVFSICSSEDKEKFYDLITEYTNQEVS